MKKGVVVIFTDGTSQKEYFYGDNVHHDDVLWNILANKQMIPDSYKRLTSKDLNFKHEVSSIGRESFIAAANGMVVMFLVYGEDPLKEKYTIGYLPEKLTDEQYRSILPILTEVNDDTLHNAYHVGTIFRGLSYQEIDDISYIPEFYDEFLFDSVEEFKEYLENKKNISRK